MNMLEYDLICWDLEYTTKYRRKAALVLHFLFHIAQSFEKRLAKGKLQYATKISAHTVRTLLYRCMDRHTIAPEFCDSSGDICEIFNYGEKFSFMLFQDHCSTARISGDRFRWIDNIEYGRF